MPNIEPDQPRRSALSTRQSAGVRMKFGKSVRFAARVDVTPAGLLAVGALASAILLSVVPIVAAAGRARARRGAPGHAHNIRSPGVSVRNGTEQGPD